jgi:hypothetical protein
MWRGVERLASKSAAVPSQGLALTSSTRVRELHELIAALDRRVPRMEHRGEASIASDAAALKVEALKQIAELEHELVAVSPCSMFGSEKAAAG